MKKRKLKNLLLKKICNVVIDDDLIKYDVKSDRFNFKGKWLDVNSLRNLKEEAKLIKSTMLWKIITNSLREEARLTMNEKAKDFNDMMFGKMALYVIALQEKIIDKFKTK